MDESAASVGPKTSREHREYRGGLFIAHGRASIEGLAEGEVTPDAEEENRRADPTGHWDLRGTGSHSARWNSGPLQDHPSKRRTDHHLWLWQVYGPK